MKKINEQTEKITINVNHVDLGKIDLLVDNGFFTNRSDFIRSALRNELAKNDNYIDEKIEKMVFILDSEAKMNRAKEGQSFSETKKDCSK